MASFGHNLGYIDELYASYRSDPQSVSAAWRDFFADWRPEAEHAERRGTSPAASKATQPEGTPAAPTTTVTEPLRGPAARLVANMTQSLSVPTATSVRTVAVKLLEENRRIINQHQATVAGPKISFTHLIAWAVLRAFETYPRLRARYAEIDGQPARQLSAQVNLGIAIDVERRGERALVVPRVLAADRLDISAFIVAYDELVGRARQGRLSLEDFEDPTVTLTNPGMLGTSLSVPRLMAGQGLILGIGSIGYPAEYVGMSPEVVADLGLSKVMTLTSTYDHRVIQGAESGAFLAEIERLLLGHDGFYQRIFTELRVPHDPVSWQADRGAALLGAANGSEVMVKQAGVAQMIRAYRVRGHLLADLDPLGYNPEPAPELELSTWGLTIWDLDRRYVAPALAGQSGLLPLREILDTLKLTYCGHIGVEYMHIQDTPARLWLQERMERTRNAEPLSHPTQLRILERLNAAEAFETFLGTNYVGQKRFSLEGAETLIPMLDALLSGAATGGFEEVVFGMAHRGRLNVLANVIGKSYGQIFREFEGDIDPQTTHGSGDVKYHLGASGDVVTAEGRQLRVAVASNPSHLEAVNPVVEGMVRALQDLRGDTHRERVLPVLIHGDAAFSGQGVVAETLNLSQLKGYRTGGTIHVVVNNQIGFTTGPADLRSSHYATDVAKILRSPIFHVNGDHPEAAVRVMQLALAFRQAFKRDVIIDLLCYRRWGHNEADDPSYTHPMLYARIQEHRSVRKLYTERLMRAGELDLATAERALEDFRLRLQAVHDEVQRAQSEPPPPVPVQAPLAVCTDLAGTDTRVPLAQLDTVLCGLDRMPDGFTVHPKLDRQFARRRERFDRGEIDWALAEAFAFGTLALGGTPVRLSGEDSGRGTFSQRHAMLYDYRSAEPWVPLAHLAPQQAPFHVVDSLLSEFAVMGFEYGYSVTHPEALVLWEAQFGDFCNGAQVVIDQFLCSARAKWGQTSGLVLLLPHGFEGQGPEHSSARLERFLQLAADDNLRIAYPSTPAQYFHLLRAQALHPQRRPLIVMTPKSLLRHRACVSSPRQMADGSFHPVLSDPREPAPAAVRRLVLCSGKVWFDLDERREAAEVKDAALWRLEQIYPFPEAALSGLLAAHPSAEEIVWVQEEPSNMGAWSFVSDALRDLLGPGRSLRYVGRPRAASPATGSYRRHSLEQERLVEAALRPASCETGDSVSLVTPR